MAIVPAMTTPAETDRRLGDLLRYGTVCEVNDWRCRVRLDEGFETDWIDMPLLRCGNVRIWAPYSVDEQVSLVCPDGDIAAATIHASHASREFPAWSHSPKCTSIDWADGSRIVYDPDQKWILVHAADGMIRLSAPKGLEILGDVEIDGKLKATGEISSDDDVKADSVSLKNHDHEETGALTKKPRQ